MKWAADSLKAAFLNEELLCLEGCQKEGDPDNSTAGDNKTHRAQFWLSVCMLHRLLFTQGSVASQPTLAFLLQVTSVSKHRYSPVFSLDPRVCLWCHNFLSDYNWQFIGLACTKEVTSKELWWEKLMTKAKENIYTKPALGDLNVKPTLLF